MSKIEEIVYEAYELGFKNEIFEKVSELKINEKYKYVPLSEIYEKALKKIKEKTKNPF